MVTHKDPQNLRASDFTKMANIFTKAHPRTFHALRYNSEAQKNLLAANHAFKEAFELLANLNMDVMDARTFEEAMSKYDLLVWEVKRLSKVLRQQQMAAKYIIEARFTEEATKHRRSF